MFAVGVGLVEGGGAGEAGEEHAGVWGGHVEVGFQVCDAGDGWFVGSL